MHRITVQSAPPTWLLAVRGDIVVCCVVMLKVFPHSSRSVPLGRRYADRAISSAHLPKRWQSLCSTSSTRCLHSIPGEISICKTFSKKQNCAVVIHTGPPLHPYAIDRFTFSTFLPLEETLGGIGPPRWQGLAGVLLVRAAVEEEQEVGGARAI